MRRPSRFMSEEYKGCFFAVGRASVGVSKDSLQARTTVLNTAVVRPLWVVALFRKGLKRVWT